MPIDFGPKAEEYKTVKSLRHYVVLAQDEVQAWIWSRSDGDEWTGPDLETSKLELTGIGVFIDMKELYAGVVATA